MLFAPFPSLFGQQLGSIDIQDIRKESVALRSEISRLRLLIRRVSTKAAEYLFLLLENAYPRVSNGELLTEAKSNVHE